MLKVMLCLCLSSSDPNIETCIYALKCSEVSILNQVIEDAQEMEEEEAISLRREFKTYYSDQFEEKEKSPEVWY